MAQWTTSYVNDLPDSSFLHIEAGGSKDSDGKTTPRSLRHFPVKDANGTVDLPHLRNALARIPQSALPPAVKAAATAKAQKLLSAAGGGAKSAPPRENLYRAVMPGPELREAQDGGMPTLAGHFAVFNQWTEVDSVFEGNFLERVAPGAFKKTIAEGRDGMKVLFQHGHDPQIGDKPLGPIRSLAEDDTGAAYEVTLLDTSYNRDLLPGLKAGLYGASFRFKVTREDFNNDAKVSVYNPRGLPERTITEASVREFGPVTFPAYEGATAGVRSLTDEFLFERMLRDPERLKQLISFLPERQDTEDLSTLAEMIMCGARYIDEQDEPGDAANIPKMQAIIQSLTELMPYELTEDEGTEPDDEGDSMASMSGDPAPATAVAALSGTTATARRDLYGTTTYKKGAPTWRLP